MVPTFSHFILDCPVLSANNADMDILIDGKTGEMFNVRASSVYHRFETDRLHPHHPTRKALEIGLKVVKIANQGDHELGEPVHEHMCDEQTQREWEEIRIELKEKEPPKPPDFQCSFSKTCGETCGPPCVIYDWLAAPKPPPKPDPPKGLKWLETLPNGARRKSKSGRFVKLADGIHYESGKVWRWYEAGENLELSDWAKVASPETCPEWQPTEDDS